MQIRRTILFAAAASLAAPAVLRAQIAETRHEGDLSHALAADGRFSSFITILQRAGALDVLRGGGRYTVFAPTDAGVDTIPANIRATLTPTPTNTNTSGGADPVALQAIAALHMVEGVYPVASFTAPSTLLRSRNGTMLKIDRNAANNLVVTLGDNAGPGVGGFNMPRPALILSPVITAGNGIILPIDHALLK